MKKQPWPALAHLDGLTEARELYRVEPGVYDAIADRLESAVASESSEPLEEAWDLLTKSLRLMVKHASSEIRDTIRGADHADQKLLTAFWAGQMAFAEGFAARALEKRADNRFAARLTDRRYERYVRALLERPKTGDELAAATGEAKETVSRKLAVLAHLGVVERRRQGNHVVNVLSPPAKSYLKHKNIAPWSSGRAPALPKTVADALEVRAKAMPGHLQMPPVLGVRAG